MVTAPEEVHPQGQIVVVEVALAEFRRYMQGLMFQVAIPRAKRKALLGGIEKPAKTEMVKARAHNQIL